MTAGQLLDFVLENKGDKVFRNLSKEEIAGLLVEGLRDETIYFSETSDGKITGMILAYRIPERKVMFVRENLAMNLRNLTLFAKKLAITYPGWSIEALRHGALRQFNTSKLYKKLI